MIRTMSEDDWRERAVELHEEGGVPERRAQAVALRESGHSYGEIADALDVESASSMRLQVVEYLDGRERAAWLLEHGPTEDDL